MRYTSDIDDLVYYDYLDIDYNAYQERIRFFEKQREVITELPYEMRLELSLDYVNALFEVGDYYGYLKHIDKLLETVLMDNVYDLNGVDIYQELLFKKASSYYNIVDHVRAEHVYSELIKIDPENRIYQLAYAKNYTDHRRYESQKTRGFVIALFILTGMVIGIELLVIRPFYSELAGAFELIRNLTFSSGLSIMVVKELAIRIGARKEILSIIKNKTK